VSRSVKFKLHGPALDAAIKFSNDLGMPLNYAAERALLWAIRQAYVTTTEGTTLAPESLGTDKGLSGSEDPNPSALAESPAILDTTATVEG
jgi:hypothetical protein